MLIIGFKSSNSKIQIDHPKQSKLENKNITLDDVFDKYFKKLVLEDVIFEHCSSFKYETSKTTFTMYHALKERFQTLENYFAKNNI